MRLWIDTDVGDNPDDAVALLCADAHPDVDVVGVSTTGGRTEWRAELAREFTEASVVAGEHPDELVAAVTAAQPDAMLAIGPLTNIAALMALGVAPPVLTVMGGVLVPLRHRGRLRRVEWNFSRDPSAAGFVLAGMPTTVVPLDVTVAMRLEPAQLDRLAAAVPRLVPEIERWVTEQDEPVVLHDPLALLVAIGDSIVTVESARAGGGRDRRDGARRGARP